MTLPLVLLVLSPEAYVLVQKVKKDGEDERGGGDEQSKNNYHFFRFHIP